MIYDCLLDNVDIIKFEILLCLQVIPEFDMPGHGHAAVNAMLARYRKFKDTNITQAEEFLLSDLSDPSEYLSVQYFTDNAMNPCRESTYTFVRHLLTELMAIHSGIQPLMTFNFGGDEVPNGAWVNSTSCMGSDNSTDEMKLEFVLRVAQIVNDVGLDLAGWEDGFTKHEDGKVVPIDVDSLLVDNVYGYFWNNVWEWGNGERAYVMANGGYKVRV
jgi:hexosaminidase